MLALFNKILSKLAFDKVQHFIFGALLSQPFAPLGALVGAVLAARNPALTTPLAVAIGAAIAPFLAALVIGKLKEVMDQSSNDAAAEAGLPPPHEVSNKDMLATAMGGVWTGAWSGLLVMLTYHVLNRLAT